MDEIPNSSAANASFEFDALNQAVNYRNSLIAHFRRHLKGDVLEAGAGIGQMTELIACLPGVERVHAVEPDPEFCRHLRNRLPTAQVTEGTLKEFTGGDMDALVSINVLEHIAEDGAELIRYRQALAGRKGHLCLFVPARQEIYAPLDHDFGHHRRYSRPELREKLEAAGFEIVGLHYFNLIGYFSWAIMFKLLGSRKFKAGSLRLFDRRIFPVGHWLETRICRPPLGQSLIAVARA